MSENQQENNREKFLRAYANLPLSTRTEIILVLDKGPMTWDVAYFEVKNRTKKSEEILHKLALMDLI